MSRSARSWPNIWHNKMLWTDANDHGKTNAKNTCYEPKRKIRIQKTIAWHNNMLWTNANDHGKTHVKITCDEPKRKITAT